jgi:hypothetical protein
VTTLQAFIFRQTDGLQKKFNFTEGLDAMDPLDELLKGPELVKSDELTAPILYSAQLLGIDVWREAIDNFDIFAGAEANASLSLEQQQYLWDLRVDRHLYDTLAREFELLGLWLQKNPQQPQSAQVRSLLQRQDRLGARSWIDQQEHLYLWAQKNERDDVGASILGWRLLCMELAESLLIWSSQHQDDLRQQQIQLWQDSQGFYPQNRLRIWALRFPEDARAPQILKWEAIISREVSEAHPELLSRTRQQTS